MNNLFWSVTGWNFRKCKKNKCLDIFLGEFVKVLKFCRKSKNLQRLCNIFELRMKYYGEKLKDSFDTNATFLRFSI